MRDNTEPPETIEIHANTLAETNPFDIVKSVEMMLKAPRNWANPYGDGSSGKRIFEIIQEKYGL